MQSEYIHNTSFDLCEEIAAGQTIDSLKAFRLRLLDLTDFAIRSGGNIKDIVHTISQCNNAITIRLLELLEITEGISLPAGVAYLALGSEGRGEQTLCSDQDSAIVYTDDFPLENLCIVEQFATRLVDALEEIGVTRCPGNIMISNSQWRHSLSEWKLLLNQWITVPTPEHMLKFSIFQDVRPLHGDLFLGTELQEYIRKSVHKSVLFFPNMALHATRFRPPIGMFSRIKVERSGCSKGKLDIKKAGIFSITAGTSLIGLGTGVVGGTTWDKLEQLGKLKVINIGDLKNIEGAFTYLVKLRLQWQIRVLLTGCMPTNYIDPLDLTDIERNNLRVALKNVKSYHYLFHKYYQLGNISI